MRKLYVLAFAAVAAGALLLQSAEPGHAAGGEETPPFPSVEWSFDGVFGAYDNAQLQRGAQVFFEVCSACHTLRQVMDLGRARSLAQIGLEGETIREYVSTYNERSTAREGQAQLQPPDLSLMAKARDGGPSYIHALLQGYEEPPEGVEVPSGQFWNVYFPGGRIAMAPPLTPDRVSYADENAPPATVDQMSQDVAAFLMWTAEPNLSERHRLGAKVILFLILLSIVFYAIKRKVWADVEH